MGVQRLIRSKSRELGEWSFQIRLFSLYVEVVECEMRMFSGAQEDLCAGSVAYESKEHMFRNFR